MPDLGALVVGPTSLWSNSLDSLTVSTASLWAIGVLRRLAYTRSLRSHGAGQSKSGQIHESIRLTASSNDFKKIPSQIPCCLKTTYSMADSRWAVATTLATCTFLCLIRGQKATAAGKPVNVRPVKNVRPAGFLAWGTGWVVHSDGQKTADVQ